MSACVSDMCVCLYTYTLHLLITYVCFYVTLDPFPVVSLGYFVYNGIDATVASMGAECTCHKIFSFSFSSVMLFGRYLCVAECTLTLQFLQLFHIIIVTLMFPMNVIKTLLFLSCNSGVSLSKLITYSL